MRHETISTDRKILLEGFDCWKDVRTILAAGNCKLVIIVEPIIVFNDQQASNEESVLHLTPIRHEMLDNHYMVMICSNKNQ